MFVKLMWGVKQLADIRLLYRHQVWLASTTTAISYQQISDCTKAAHNSQLFSKLQQFATDNPPVQEKQIDWSNVVQHIEQHPPTTLKEFRSCLLWSNRINIPLNLDVQLSSIPLKECSLQDIISVYLQASDANLHKGWTNLRTELFSRLVELTKQGKSLSYEDLNSILEGRYHHLFNHSRLYLDYSIPRVIIDSLKTVLARPGERTHQQQSYLVLYSCAMEYQCKLMPELAQDVVKLVNPIIRDAQKRVDDMSHKQLTNYVAAAALVNRGFKLPELVAEIQRHLNSKQLGREDLQLCVRLITSQYRSSKSKGTGLFSSKTLHKLCRVAATNMDLLSDANKLVRMFNHFNHLLKNTDVPKEVLKYCQQLYREKGEMLSMGFEYAAINQLPFAETLNKMVKQQEGNEGRKDYIRLTLLCSEVFKSHTATEKLTMPPHYIMQVLRTTLLQENQQYKSLCRRMLNTIVGKAVGDTQLFRQLLMITTKEHINRVVEWLSTLKIKENDALRRSLIVALLRVTPHSPYNQNKLALIHTALTKLPLSQADTSSFIAENNQLICAFMLSSQPERFYDLIGHQSRVFDLGRIYVYFQISKLGSTKRIKQMMATHPDAFSDRTVFKLILNAK